MALMTGKEYVESIRRMKRNIYFQGEKLENPVDHPVLRPSMNCLIETYELAQLPDRKQDAIPAPEGVGDTISQEKGT